MGPRWAQIRQRRWTTPANQGLCPARTAESGAARLPGASGQLAENAIRTTAAAGFSEPFNWNKPKPYEIG